MLRLIEASLDAGVDGVGLSDTVGVAQPTTVYRLFSKARSLAGDVPLTAHLHASGDRTADNVVAALRAGVDRFDASIAGIGGNRFLPDVRGNVSIEEIAALLVRHRIATSVEPARLRELHAFVRKQPGAQELFSAPPEFDPNQADQASRHRPTSFRFGVGGCPDPAAGS